MTPVPLAEFVDLKGQETAAKLLGVSQTAICKALKVGRHIVVSEACPGLYEAVELKSFPAAGSQDKMRPDLGEILAVIAPIAQHLNGAVQPSSTQQFAQ